MVAVAAGSVTDTFRALGDPVRLSIVRHLADCDQATVNELADLFPISVQAVSRHVKVLVAADIVSQHAEGRHRPIRLEPSTVRTATDWLDGRLSDIDARHERLDLVLADLQEGSHDEHHP